MFKVVLRILNSHDRISLIFFKYCNLSNSKLYKNEHHGQVENVESIKRMYFFSCEGKNSKGKGHFCFWLTIIYGTVPVNFLDLWC